MPKGIKFSVDLTMCGLVLKLKLILMVYGRDALRTELHFASRFKNYKNHNQVHSFEFPSEELTF